MKQALSILSLLVILSGNALAETRYVSDRLEITVFGLSPANGYEAEVSRVVQDVVSTDTKGKVNPLMAAMGPNVAGVIGSAVAAGVLLAVVGGQ